MNGLYYQRGIKLKHVVEKGAQYFTKERINMALTNIHNFVKRERNKEIRTIYSAGNYLLFPSFKNRQATFGTHGTTTGRNTMLKTCKATNQLLKTVFRNLQMREENRVHMQVKEKFGRLAFL